RLWRSRSLGLRSASAGAQPESQVYLLDGSYFGQQIGRSNICRNLVLERCSLLLESARIYFGDSHAFVAKEVKGLLLTDRRQRSVDVRSQPCSLHGDLFLVFG